MGAPGPSSFLAVLVGHIATGLVGFLVGTHSGPLAFLERDFDHLVEVAVEIATKRCGEVVERQLGPGEVTHHIQNLVLFQNPLIAPVQLVCGRAFLRS